MIKQIDDALYEVICGWWIKRGWEPINRLLLPQRGFVVFSNEKPILCGFLYKDETCAFSLMDWVISNPESTKEERDHAFPILFQKIQEEATSAGAKVILTTTKNKSLIERLESYSFVQSDIGITLLLKGV